MITMGEQVYLDEIMGQQKEMEHLTETYIGDDFNYIKIDILPRLKRVGFLDASV